MIGLEFVVDDSDVVGGIGLRGVDDVDEEAGALDMAEELEAEAVSFVGALDQAREVGHDVGVVANLDDAEHRLQCREGVVGDLRLGAGDGREQGGLAGVGQADEPDIGDEFELELDGDFLATLAGLGDLGRLSPRCREVLVAAAALAAHGYP